jgi:hypothetical protein
MHEEVFGDMRDDGLGDMHEDGLGDVHENGLGDMHEDDMRDDALGGFDAPDDDERDGANLAPAGDSGVEDADADALHSLWVTFAQATDQELLERLTRLLQAPSSPPAERKKLRSGTQSIIRIQHDSDGDHAVKCLHEEHDLRRALFEIYVRRHCIHELICPISYIVLGQHAGSISEIHMPYMQYGSLADIIDRVAKSGKPPDFWTPTNQAKIIVTSAILLHSLHSKGVTHGNVSLKSFLINDNFSACAHSFLPDGIEGWTRYQATEINESFEKTSSADIFALAIVIYEVAMGRHAFECDGRTAYGRIRQGEMPSLSGIPSKCLDDVIQNCWLADAGKRYTARTILEKFEACGFKILPDVDEEEVRQVYGRLHALPIPVILDQ